MYSFSFFFLPKLCIGTIVCDFNNDWCDFARNTNGDDKSKQGFGWTRKNSNEIQSQNLEGPDQGSIILILLICF